MIIAADVGNTCIAIGVYDVNDVLIRHFVMPSDLNTGLKDFEDFFISNLSGIKEFDGAIIGSVVDELNDRICYAILDLYNIQPVMLTSDMNTGITIALKNNSEIGADRIANGYRAYELYKRAVIAVDFGTATTFDIVNSKGIFVGGIIAPGINTQLSSLNNSTSKLPKINAGYIDKVIGKCTFEAVLSGVVRGTACMADGMLGLCEAELGEKAAIISTGGFSNIISKYMVKKFDAVISNLTLEGLRDLYKLNSKAKIF